MLTLASFCVLVMCTSLWVGDFIGRKIRHVIDPNNIKAGKPIWSKPPAANEVDNE